jgi:hypothetical protein
MMTRKFRARVGAFPFEIEPGWSGAFTRAQAPGAMPNGAKIVKGRGEVGDSTPEGAPGVVLGSFSHPEVCNGAVCYFVEWADRPRVAVAVINWKIKPDEAPE